MARWELDFQFAARYSRQVVLTRGLRNVKNVVNGYLFSALQNDENARIKNLAEFNIQADCFDVFDLPTAVFGESWFCSG